MLLSPALFLSELAFFQDYTFFTGVEERSPPETVGQAQGPGALVVRQTAGKHRRMGIPAGALTSHYLTTHLMGKSGIESSILGLLNSLYIAFDFGTGEKTYRYLHKLLSHRNPKHKLV